MHVLNLSRPSNGVIFGARLVRNLSHLFVIHVACPAAPVSFVSDWRSASSSASLTTAGIATSSTAGHASPRSYLQADEAL